MTKDIKKEVLDLMRNPKLYLGKVVDYVEENIEDAFNYPCRKGLSLNEWQPDTNFKDQVNQKTVFLTVRMFDLWENALVEVLNEELKKIGVKVVHAHDSVGDLAIILPNKEVIKWEVKSTQSKGDSFTGATHSASKCDNYILISYSLDKDKKLNKKDNTGIITELAVFVWDNMTSDWIGKPSMKSSWTVLRIPITVLEKSADIIVVGELIPKNKWCKIKKEKLV